MTDKINEADEFASGDLDPDLTSIWDETDDDGILLPDDSAEDDLDDEETDQDEDSTEGGEDESDEDTEDGASDDENDEAEDEDENTVDYEALYKKAQHEVKTMAGRLKAAEARSGQPKTEETLPAPKQPKSPFTDEEQALIDNFRNTYSEEVVKVIGLLTKHQAEQLVESTLQTRLTPVEQMTQSMVEQAHFAAIQSVHPDIAEVDSSPVFEDWLDTRPAHLKDAYIAIRERGTPTQVIAMVTEFKEATGAKKKVTNPEVKNTRKAQSATAVKHRRGSVSVKPKRVETDLAALWDEIDE